jgi:hypothetical protein
MSGTGTGGELGFSRNNQLTDNPESCSFAGWVWESAHAVGVSRIKKSESWMISPKQCEAMPGVKPGSVSFSGKFFDDRINS